MRTGISYILLLIGFLLISLTDPLVYLAQRSAAIDKFISSRDSFSPDQIKTIIISEQSINWEKKFKEFFFNDNLYDVITIEKIGFEFVIRCVADKSEDRIVAAFIRSVDKSLKDKIKPPTIKDQQCITLTISLPLFSYKYFIHEIQYVETDHLTPCLEIFSPPPEQCLI